MNILTILGVLIGILLVMVIGGGIACAILVSSKSDYIEDDLKY